MFTSGWVRIFKTWPEVGERGNRKWSMYLIDLGFTSDFYVRQMEERPEVACLINKLSIGVFFDVVDVVGFIESWFIGVV